MDVIPAIDLLSGRCVRLYQGDYEQSQIFAEDPVTVAQSWADQGAQWLHLVDLDGAKTGEPVNLSVIAQIVETLNIPVQDVESYGLSGTFEWTLSDAFTLKSITAYRKDRTHTPIDFDALPAADVDVPAIYRNKQISQELQILYSGDKLNGLVGGYWLDANAFNIFDVILGTTGALIGVPGLTASTLGNVDTKTWSLFGDFTYDFTDQISLSVGGRYTSDERTSTVLRRNLAGGASPELGGVGAAIATTSNFNGSKTFKEFTPKLAEAS